MLTSSLFALAVSLATTSAAALQGFNYGSTFTDGSPKMESDYQSEFTTAQNLVGTSGFTSARLYTMIVSQMSYISHWVRADTFQQAGTTNSPIEAIQAAINTKTSLLLGLWASAGQADFNNELSALSQAISMHGSAFGSAVIGISVGSEDLYRISPTGIAGNDGIGAGPDVITNFIGQVRTAIANTPLSGAPVGHVDTWTAWVNSSNDAVIAASDFIGMDAYPYFQNTEDNSIETGNVTFFEAYYNTTAAVGSKPVWITETGWPVSGPTENLAVPSIANAQTYWDQVACTVLGKINTFWYTLQDAAPSTPSPSFGLVGSTLSTTPLYNLTCPAVGAAISSSSSSAASSAAATSSATTSIASSQGASAIASKESGLTSSAGSGPIVISAESSPASSVVAASTTLSASTMVTAVPVSSIVYTTEEITVTSCGSSITNCPAKVSTTMYAVSTTVFTSSATSVAAASVVPVSPPASSSIVATSVSGLAPGSVPFTFITTVVSVAPGSSTTEVLMTTVAPIVTGPGSNATVSTGGIITPASPSATIAVGGGSVVTVRSIAGTIAVLFAVVAAL
ncbi:hypothetical protein MMC26_004700 [Xylographa opegraphella]|nr:hypothetical protein [Xylographa opegraphella]